MFRVILSESEERVLSRVVYWANGITLLPRIRTVFKRIVFDYFQTLVSKYHNFYAEWNNAPDTLRGGLSNLPVTLGLGKALIASTPFMNTLCVRNNLYFEVLYSELEDFIFNSSPSLGLYLRHTPPPNGMYGVGNLSWPVLEATWIWGYLYLSVGHLCAAFPQIPRVSDIDVPALYSAVVKLAYSPYEERLYRPFRRELSSFPILAVYDYVVLYDHRTYSTMFDVPNGVRDRLESFNWTEGRAERHANCIAHHGIPEYFATLEAHPFLLDWVMTTNRRILEREYE